MDADQIEERLLFELRATRHEDLFSGASAVDLVMHLRRGAKTMAAEERTSDADLELASRNLQAFMVEMEARRDEMGLTEFHEITVSEAFSRVCPGLWPFC